MATNHEANVTLGGDASGAQAAAKAASKEVDAFTKTVDKAKLGSKALSQALTDTTRAWNVQAEAAKKAETANFVAAARMENAKQRAADLDRVFGKVGQTSTVAANGITRLGTAAHGSRGTVQLLGSAVHNVAVGASSMLGAVNQVAAGFGPLGVAVAAGVTILGHFAHSQYEAAKATEEAKKKIREEVAALKDLTKQERITELMKAEQASRGENFFGAATPEATVARERAKQLRKEIAELEKREGARAKESARQDSIQHAADLKTQGRVKDIEEEIFELEKAKVIAKNEGADSKAFEVEILRKQADIAHELGDMDEQAKLMRQAEIRDLEEVNKKEKHRTTEKEKQLKASKAIAEKELASMLAGPNFSAEGKRLRNAQANALFSSELQAARFSGMQRGDGRAERVHQAELAANDVSRNIQLEQAGDIFSTDEEKIARIEREKAALLSLAEVREQVATTGADKEAALEEQRRINHEAHLQRLAVEREQEEERLRVMKSGIDRVVDITGRAVSITLSLTDARRDAVRQARLQGKTEQEAARAGKAAMLQRTVDTLRSVRDEAAKLAIMETGKGFASLASQDYQGATLHFIAAGIFGGAAAATGIGARAMEDRADRATRAADADSGRGGGSGGGRGTSPRSAPFQPPAPIDSSIPGSPSPQAPSSGGGMRSSGVARGGISIGTLHLYGTPPDDFIRTIDQGLRDQSHDRRLASRTGTDG